MRQLQEQGLGKKLIAVLTMTVFLLGVLVQPALALDFGVYTASTTTNYLNPDTGVTEDGGTQNVELGEGMCRSAVGETALIEVDADGNIYVTMRMLLYSNLSKIKFYTQAKSGGSYSAVKASITAEDAANDSADFRFKVPKAGCNVKTTMYVAPMGRDVTFFWHVNAGAAKAGSGDFVVNIDLNAKPKAEEPAKAAAPAKSEPAKSEPAKSEPTQTTTVKAESAKTDNSNTNSNAGNSTNTVKTDTDTKAVAASAGTSSAVNSESKADPSGQTDKTADNEPAENEPAENEPAEEAQPEDGDPAADGDAINGDNANADGDADADNRAADPADTEPAESADEQGDLPVVPIVCVVVVLVAAVAFIMKRK